MGIFSALFKIVAIFNSSLRVSSPASSNGTIVDITFVKIAEELGGFRQIGKVIPLIQEFGTAQDALKVAQQGTASLTDAAAEAQKSLIVQLAKVREEFDALVRSIAGSKTFKTLLSTTLALTKGLLGLANVFKPILPILAIMGGIKLGGAALNIGKGISSSFKGFGGSGGGAGTAGSGGRGPSGGSGDQNKLIDSLL